MKNSLIFLGTLVAFVSISQPINQTYTYPNGKIVLLGKCTEAAFLEEPYASWYRPTFDSYRPDETLLSGLKLNPDLPDSIVVFFGSWCGDSRQHVPAFMKLMQDLEFPSAKITLVGLNSGFQQYKQSMGRYEKDLNNHRVPTFIFFNEAGSEIQRIVESPVVSFEADLVEIIKGNYQSKYYAVEWLHQYLIQTENDQISDEELVEVTQILKALATKSSELNTYAIRLMSSFEMAKARVVLKLNCLVFPNEPAPLISLCRFLQLIDDQVMFEQYVTKGTTLFPENQDILALTLRNNQ